MRVFVAGATGVIGRVLVPKLVAAGHEVTGMTRSPARAEGLREAGATAAIADAYDAGAVREAVAAARPEVVVDQLTDLPAAFPSSRGGMKRAYAANDRVRLEGCANVHAAAQAAGARRYVAQSVCFFCDARPSPVDESAPLATGAPEPMGASARAVAALEARVLAADGPEGVVLRYGWFYGPGTYFAPGGSIAEAVRARRYPVVGDGGASPSFVHVEDAAGATVTAVEDGATGVFHICADRAAPAREWLPAYAEALGAPPPRRVPAWLVRLAAGRGAVWFLTAISPASNARARAELGFSPRPMGTPAET